MAFFENLSKTVTGVGQKTIAKTKELADTSRLNSMISEEEKVITNQEENDFLFSYMKQEGYSSAYFGFSDSANEGTWTWCNGEQSSYTNWHSGEPNNENQSENYALFYYKYSDGSWNDGDFGNKTDNDGTAFICEWGEYSSNPGGEKNGEYRDSRNP